MVYHVDSHVASCSMEIHMVNHEVGMRCSQSPESANVAVGKATVWSAPRGDAGSIVHTHSSSQTPGKLASVVVYTEPLPQLTQITLLEEISNKRAATAAAAQELYLMEAATVAAG